MTTDWLTTEAVVNPLLAACDDSSCRMGSITNPGLADVAPALVSLLEDVVAPYDTTATVDAHRLEAETDYEAIVLVRSRLMIELRFQQVRASWRQTITGVRFERPVAMIRDEPELLPLVLRLQQSEQAETDFFADHSLPEYTVVDELDLTASEAARFLTLSLVPFHAHPSGRPKPQVGRAGFWRVCKNLWQQHQWVYDPHRLVTTEGKQELEAFFDRLDIMDAYDAHWWFTSAGTLFERFDGDPEEILQQAAHVAPHAARLVRGADLPGIADAVSTPFWLRLMHDRVASLAGMGWVSLPVDHTLFAVTEALGDLDVDISDREDREMIQTFWEVFCEKHGLVPYRVEKSLRVVGLYWHRGGRDYVASVLEEYR